MSTKDTATLPRVLGPVTALCVIVGSVIGSGIFIVPARVAHEVPSIGGIATVWVVGGLFTLAGALTLAELGAMLPRAGGPYVYLREAYGPLFGFLFGWTEFLVIRAGSVATLAAAFALYFAQLAPAPAWLGGELWRMAAAVAAIATVAVVNVIGTRVGGALQVAGTTLKVGALGVMIVLPFLLGQADSARLTPVRPGSLNLGMLQGMMVAMVAVLWAYDGWVNSTALAEEVRNPERNMPLSLILGALILIAIYVTMTMVYHMVLTLPEIQSAATEKGSSKVVAAEFCGTLLGPAGITAISLVVMGSTFISLNGNAMSGPRAYFAMARDGLFPQRLCEIHPRFQTPANAVIAQSAWASLLTVTATALIVAPAPGASSGLPAPLLAAWTKLNQTPLYDVLYEYVIFGGTLFYMLTVLSVFVLRVKRPNYVRPYRTWGYPVTPALYIMASLLLMGNMLVHAPFGSLAGLLLIALGLPVYWLYIHKKPVAEDAVEPGR
ncbi:MAG: amino acid permease [Isosphaeraceae bacterium]|nr:amino acid permease [Isosphaeraceae bacterium]